MKLKLILALGLTALAGLASALVLAGPTQAGDGTTGTTTTGTTTGKHGDGHRAKSSCQKVELRGSSASGSVAFTVTKANHDGSSLVGKQVTLTVPTGSALSATACVDAAGVLTLRSLQVKAPHPVPAARTTTTTTGATSDTFRSHKHGSHKQ